MSRYVLTAAAAALLMGCGGDNISGQVREVQDPEVDKLGPIIEHDPVTGSQVFGQDIFLEAIVTDPRESDTGVALVEVFYRQETSVEFKSRGFTPVGGGLYQGTIRGADVASGGMRYFIRAQDWAENDSCLPEECEDETWHFSIIPAS